MLEASVEGWCRNSYQSVLLKRRIEMISSPESEVDRAFWPIFLTLRTMGLLPDGHDSKLYKLRGLFVFLFFMVTQMLAMIVRLIVEAEKVAENMYATLCVATFTVNLCVFRLRWCAIESLLQTAWNFRPESGAEVRLFRLRMTFIRRVVVTLFVALNFASASAVLKVFLSDAILFPYPVWYPEDWRHGTRYWFALAHATSAVAIGANACAALEGLTTMLLFVISVRLEMLSYRLKSMDTLTESSLRDCMQLHMTILTLSIFAS